MHSRCDLLIVGSGSLASELCLALSVQPDRLRVLVAARSAPALDEIVTLANARALALGGRVRIASRALRSYARGELAELGAAARPRVVVVAASLQSPWALADRKSRWARLVDEGGFGITVALQAALALAVGDAFAQTGLGAALVNACYPDAVNALLRARRIAVAAGIGNVAILAALLAAPAAPRERVRLIAHHAHVVALLRGQRVAGAILTRGRARVDANASFEPLRHALARMPGATLNALTAVTALPLLRALLSGGSCEAHVPGPLGLPGGYPVSVRRGTVALNLPPDVSRANAVASNRRAAFADGVVVSEDGAVTFSGRARRELAAYSPALARGFHARDAEFAAAEFVRLREALCA